MALRNLTQLDDLGRNPIENHLRAAERKSGDELNPIDKFSGKAWLKWLATYTRSFLPNHRFLGPEAAPAGTFSVYRDLPGNLRIAMAADWGSGTLEARCVAERMMDCPEGEIDLTVHLGDVYYIGEKAEILENCLGGGELEHPKARVRWPIGRSGSFALQGNHEMYSNGTAYFNTFLPRLGWKNAAGAMQGQGPSFFCLENAHWRIIGLDTGYNDDSYLKLYPKRCTLPPKLMDWLRDSARPGGDKATILLSHHQCVSAFEKEYDRPAKQLEDLLGGRSVLWFCGHEHILAGYKPVNVHNILVHQRCIGNGGMPAKPKAKPTDRRYLFHDHQRNTRYPAEEYGYNGFAQLLFNGPDLRVRYSLLQPDGSPNGYANTAQVFREEVFTAIDGDVVLTTSPLEGSDPPPASAIPAPIV